MVVCMRRCTVLLFSALAFIPASLAAQNTDEAAIRELLRVQTEAWNWAEPGELPEAA
jgi:hypothetical protein